MNHSTPQIAESKLSGADLLAPVDAPRIKVFIKGLGEVVASIAERYPDGSVRVTHAHKCFIVDPINQIKEY